jgi:hypothetical protein
MCRCAMVAGDDVASYCGTWTACRPYGSCAAADQQNHSSMYGTAGSSHMQICAGATHELGPC